MVVNIKKLFTQFYFFNKNSQKIESSKVNKNVTYSLRPQILVIKMDKKDVSRTKIHLDTFPFIHFDDKYFRTEGV